MRISGELDEAAAGLGEMVSGGPPEAGAVEEGLARKAREFREAGGEIYLEEDAGS